MEQINITSKYNTRGISKISAQKSIYDNKILDNHFLFSAVTFPYLSTTYFWLAAYFLELCSTSDGETRIEYWLPNYEPGHVILVCSTRKCYLTPRNTKLYGIFNIESKQILAICACTLPMI